MTQNHTKDHTAGINSIGVGANILLAAILFGHLSPWWLLLSLPLILFSTGLELVSSNPDWNAIKPYSKTGK